MDAKRRKVQVTNVDVAAAVKTGNMKLVYEAVLGLKERLTSLQDAIAFIETEKDSFFMLLTCFQKLTIEVIGASSTRNNRKSSNVWKYFSTDLRQATFTLREIISVLANLCHFSMTICTQMKSSNIGAALMQILESGDQTDENIKLNTLRFVGNICNFKETASIITGHAGLLDRIAITIMHANPHMADRSLRVVRLLSKSSAHLRFLILSNTCYFVGTRIAQIGSVEEVKKQQNILQILINLLRIYPKDVGRQLAGSGCAPILLEILFGNQHVDSSSEKNSSLLQDLQKSEKSLPTVALATLWRTFLLKLTRYSFEIREAFGSTAIERVMSYDVLDGEKCEFLCNFAQDAWCRVILREGGALSRLLDILDSSECDPPHQVKIITSLKHFIYDTQSMAYLCQRVGFVNVALAHISRLLDETRVECNVCFDFTDERSQGGIAMIGRDYGVKFKLDADDREYLNEEENEKRDSESNLIRSTGSDLVSNNDDEVESLTLTCDSSGAASPSGSVKCSPKHCTLYDRHNWSPSMSPSSSAIFNNNEFLDISPTLERSTVDFFDNSDVLNAANALNEDNMAENEQEFLVKQNDTVALELVCNDGEAESEFLKAQEKKLKQKEQLKAKQQVVDDCLDIISKLTHQEENYPFLIKPKVLETLIDYASDAPIFDFRLVRSIKRLARSKSSLQRLLEFKFHRMVITKLIRRNCILARYQFSKILVDLSYPAFAKFCTRCDQRREFGCDLIMEFAAHADSNLGWNLIQIDLRSEDRQIARDAMFNALILIRSSERSSRFFYNFLPIETFLSELEQILRQTNKTVSNGCDAESSTNFTMDSETGKICCEIVMAFSSLITQRCLNRVLNMGLKFWGPGSNDLEGYKRCSSYEANTVFETMKKEIGKECLLKELILGTVDNVEKSDNAIKNSEVSTNDSKATNSKTYSCEIIQPTEEHNQVLEFYNAKEVDKGPILIVPKRELCSSNGFFEGMFKNEFIEKVEDRYKFMFDESEDHCNELDFITFLHYLCGCRNSLCVRIQSGETCTALLYLSDKYLCSTLAKELLDTGLACALINGDNARLFIPLMLTVPSIHEALANTWAFVLLRYSTNQQIISTLSYFLENQHAIPFLIDILQSFLLACTNGGVIYQNTSVTPMWDI